MDDFSVQPGTPVAATREIAIPWYLISGGMLIATIIILFAFARPLNTSPDQTYTKAAAQQPAKP